MGAATRPRTLVIFPIDFFPPSVANALVPFCAFYAHGNATQFSVCIRRQIRACCFRQYSDLGNIFPPYFYLFIFSYFLHHFRNDTQYRKHEGKKLWLKMKQEKNVKENKQRRKRFGCRYYIHLHLRQGRWQRRRRRRWQRLACTIKKH